MEKKKETASKKKSVRSSQTKLTEEGRKQKEQYRKIKAFALEREKENWSKLFVIHEKKNWWKMVGHSAVFFQYEVAKRAGMTTKLKEDTDYELKSEEGVINIKDVLELDDKLEKAGVQPVDIKKEYRIYNIGKKYTEGDLERLQKQKELEWAKVNKIVLPKEMFPLLFADEKELLERIYFSTKLIEGYIRDIIGEPMIERAVENIREYSLMTNGKGMDTKKYLDMVEENVRWITSQITIIAELRLLEPERIFKMLKSAEAVRRNVEKCRVKVT